MEFVRSGFSNHTDLSAGSGAKLGRKIARIDTEFLHIFQTRLQAKGRRNLTVQVARTGIDDGSPFNAVVADHVLIVRTSRETDVREGSGSAVDASRRLQIKLRKLAAIDRKALDLAGVYICAHRSGADICQRFLARDDVNLGRNCLGTKRNTHL